MGRVASIIECGVCNEKHILSIQVDIVRSNSTSIVTFCKRCNCTFNITVKDHKLINVINCNILDNTENINPLKENRIYYSATLPIVKNNLLESPLIVMSSSLAKEFSKDAFTEETLVKFRNFCDFFLNEKWKDKTLIRKYIVKIFKREDMFLDLKREYQYITKFNMNLSEQLANLTLIFSAHNHALISKFDNDKSLLEIEKVDLLSIMKYNLENSKNSISNYIVNENILEKIMYFYKKNAMYFTVFRQVKYFKEMTLSEYDREYNDVDIYMYMNMYNDLFEMLCEMLYPLILIENVALRRDHKLLGVKIRAILNSPKDIKKMEQMFLNAKSKQDILNRIAFEIPEFDHVIGSLDGGLRNAISHFSIRNNAMEKTLNYKDGQDVIEITHADFLEKIYYMVCTLSELTEMYYKISKINYCEAKS